METGMSVERTGTATTGAVKAACLAAALATALQPRWTMAQDLGFLDRELRQAVRDNNMVRVRHLIDNGANVDTRSLGGLTPLTIATVRGLDSMVETLLEEGADPDIVDDYGEVALFVAMWQDIGMVEALLEEGANPNIVNGDGKTPLLIATRHGHDDLVELLLSAKADPNVRDGNDGNTALHIIAYWRRFDQWRYENIAKALLRAGANPDIKNNDGKTAWDVVVAEGNDEILEAFHEAGAEPPGLLRWPLPWWVLRLFI